MCVCVLKGECIVERIVGVTDYKTMFSNTFAKDDIHGKTNQIIERWSKYNAYITGITTAHTFRITAKADGSGIDLFYKSDIGKVGWFPRPAPAIMCTLWKTIFEHPLSPFNQGTTVPINYVQFILYYM